MSIFDKAKKKKQSTPTKIFENGGEKKEIKTINLRDIMDYDRPFSIFYSGVESKTYFDGCYNMGVRNFLMSYQYLQNSNVSLKDRCEGKSHLKFFIDSGAFTYQADPKYAEYTAEDWEKQIIRYLKWAKKHREHIFAIANLDLEFLVGVQKVREWNEKYFEPFMLETEIPVCFIFHNVPEASWEYYCQRYPFVGFPGGYKIDEQAKYLKVAEKYNTLVHGMGMTKTAELPKLPFYTVDSTTWKGGFRYGKIVIWTGTRAKMIEKHHMETVAFPLFDNKALYGDLQPPLDKKKIKAFDEPEVLRCCVWAYIKAEQLIRERHKKIIYWHKPKKIKQNEDDLTFPDVDWLKLPMNTSRPNIQVFAKKLNINPDIDETVVMVSDMTVLLNWDKEGYKEFREQAYNDELIGSLHAMWINRVVATQEEKIEDLQKFFLDCATGVRDTLLLYNTNFDRIAKEREDKDYVDDTEYDTTALSKDDVLESIKAMNLLPPPTFSDTGAPELDELEDELFVKANIIPTRDENGKIIGGEKKTKKPKKLYSKKYPQLTCDSCPNAQRCPEYKAGFVCAYNKMFDRYDTRDSVDVVQAMQGIADLAMQRLQRAMMTEVMNGGMPDPNVSNLMSQATSLLNNLRSMYELSNQEILRQTRVTRADGSQEITTQVNNPQRGGILERIFGGGMETEEKTQEDEITQEKTEEVKEENLGEKEKINLDDVVLDAEFTEV